MKYRTLIMTTRRFFAGLLLLMCATLVIAQTQVDVPIDRRWGVPASPQNCETNAVYLAQVKELMKTDQDDRLIVSARLGSRETRQDLNRRRLYNVRLKLTEELGVPKERIIIAEGERVADFGRVEFYFGGQLIGALLASRLEDLCVGCCDADERFYPYKGKARSKSRS
jgi:hypothetical protein